MSDVINTVSPNDEGFKEYEKLMSQEHFADWKINPHSIRVFKFLNNLREEFIENAEFQSGKNDDIAANYLIQSKTVKLIINSLNNPIINK